MATPCATLITGAKMPLMAYGTLMETIHPDIEATTKIIENALDVGYRHLDTARIYGTEKCVGQALKNKVDSGFLKRSDVFITTKLWRTSYGQEDVVPTLRHSLSELQLEYVDLFLIHWPTAFESGEELFPMDSDGKLKYAEIDYVDTWRGMEACVNLGLAKAIGLSNFNSKQITRILDNCRIRPSNNQIESHPFLTNTKLIDFCKERDISVMAYAPLAGFNPTYREEKNWPTIFTDKSITTIAEKHKKSPAQVVLRFQIQRGVGVAPKSSKINRMKENFDALTFELSEEDMKILESCNQNMRLNHEFPDHPYYPFHEEF